MIIQTIGVWCESCKKAQTLIFVEISEEDWICINPHEHFLPMNICPRTIWRTKDLKEESHPELTEVLENVFEDKKLLSALRNVGLIES